MQKFKKITYSFLLITYFLFSIAAPANATGFGHWESRDSNTTYFAETDGFVISYEYASPSGEGGNVLGMTPVPYVRAQESFTANEVQGEVHTLTLPVAAGDEWRIEGEPDYTVVMWLPLNRDY